MFWNLNLKFKDIVNDSENLGLSYWWRKKGDSAVIYMHCCRISVPLSQRLAVMKTKQCDIVRNETRNSSGVWFTLDTFQIILKGFLWTFDCSLSCLPIRNTNFAVWLMQGLLWSMHAALTRSSDLWQGCRSSFLSTFNFHYTRLIQVENRFHGEKLPLFLSPSASLAPGMSLNLVWWIKPLKSVQFVLFLGLMLRMQSSFLFSNIVHYFDMDGRKQVEQRQNILPS